MMLVTREMLAFVVFASAFRNEEKCANAFRMKSRNHHYARKERTESINASAAFAELQGFWSEGRWRDLFDRRVQPVSIGQGTFGAAMKVQLAPICRGQQQPGIVVVKQIKMTAQVDSQMLNNELQIQQALSDHPNLVGLYDYHPQDPRAWPKEGAVYVMMPLADGGHVDRSYMHEVQSSGIKTGKINNMMEYVASGWISGKTAEDHEKDHAARNALLSRVAMDIFSGLSHMHEKEYVHRDLKPQNIWASHKECMKKYAADCKYMIGDFGISSQAKNARMAVCGTPPYMPPEIETGGHAHHYTYHVIDGKSAGQKRIGWSKAGDVYALGLTLLAMLTGQEMVTASVGVRNLRNIEKYLEWYLGLGEKLTELFVRALKPLPGQRLSAKDAHKLAVEAHLAATGKSSQQLPSFRSLQIPLCVQECKRMSCCYNLRCALLEGKCDDGFDIVKRQSQAQRNGPDLWAIAAGAMDWAGKLAGKAMDELMGLGLEWVEEEGAVEPIGPVPPKVLPSGKVCYGQDEIPAGERAMPGLLIPQASDPAAQGTVANASNAQPPPYGKAPKLQLAGPTTLLITWEKTPSTPPVTAISVKLSVDGENMVVDATDGKNVLVPKGGQRVRAVNQQGQAVTSIRVNVRPGVYQAFVSMTNNAGSSAYSAGSEIVTVAKPAAAQQASLPPPPPPVLKSAPTPRLELVAPHVLKVSWDIPVTSPPVQTITVGIRSTASLSETFLVDTSGGKNELVPNGGLPVRAPTNFVQVKVQPGQTYDAKIALRNSAIFTPWSAESAPVQVAEELREIPMYKEGQAVDYLSASRNVWMPARVVKVDGRGVQVDIGRGEPVSFEELPRRMRPREETDPRANMGSWQMEAALPPPPPLNFAGVVEQARAVFQPQAASGGTLRPSAPDVGALRPQGSTLQFPGAGNLQMPTMQTPGLSVPQPQPGRSVPQPLGGVGQAQGVGTLKAPSVGTGGFGNPLLPGGIQIGAGIQAPTMYTPNSKVFALYNGLRYQTRVSSVSPTRGVETLAMPGVFIPVSEWHSRLAPRT